MLGGAAHERCHERTRLGAAPVSKKRIGLNLAAIPPMGFASLSPAVGAAVDFLPLASPPHATGRAGTPDAPIPREPRKPPSAVLRCASAARGLQPRRCKPVSLPATETPRRPRWARLQPKMDDPMAADRDTHDDEPPHTSSPTAHVVEELELHGFQLARGEHDPRPMPEPLTVQGALADVFDALVSTFTDTPLEPDLKQLLWSTVNVFHRMGGKAQRDLDDNEEAQKRSQREQDGSEVKSVDLERLLVEGQDRIDRRDTYEAMRDQAAEHFEVHTGSTWKPYSGSMVNRKAMTAAMIDSRDFISAKRRAETEVLIPKGAKIAFTGGMDCNDHKAIWAALDKARKLGIPLFDFRKGGGA